MNKELLFLKVNDVWYCVKARSTIKTSCAPNQVLMSKNDYYTFVDVHSVTKYLAAGYALVTTGQMYKKRKDGGVCLFDFLRGDLPSNIPDCTLKKAHITSFNPFTRVPEVYDGKPDGWYTAAEY